MFENYLVSVFPIIYRHNSLLFLVSIGGVLTKDWARLAYVLENVEENHIFCLRLEQSVLCFTIFRQNQSHFYKLHGVYLNK